MQKSVTDLKVGDRTPWYTVIGEPVKHDDGTIHVRVRHRDGGEDTRVWDEEVEIMVADE